MALLCLDRSRDVRDKPCCFCRTPGKLLLKHGNLSPAWYCGHRCLAARCQLQSVADAATGITSTPEALGGVKPTAAAVSQHDWALIGGMEGLVGTTRTLSAVVEHLMKPDPNASAESQMRETEDRFKLFQFLAKTVELVPSTVEITGHSQVIAKTLDVLRTQYGIVPAERRERILLAWQALYAAATANGIRLDASYVPPIVPGVGAPQMPQLPVQPPGALVPSSPAQPGAGSFGQGMAPVPLSSAVKSIEADIKKIIKRSENHPDNVYYAAIGEFAIDLVNERGRTEASAKKIGALLRAIIMEGNAGYQQFASIRGKLASPSPEALAIINSKQALDPTYIGAVTMFYMIFAHKLIDMFLKTLTAVNVEAIKAQMMGKMSDATSNRALALGGNAPKEGSEALQNPGQDARFNWVQALVETARSLRSRTLSVLVNPDDPAFANVIQAAALIHPSRW